VDQVEMEPTGGDGTNLVHKGMRMACPIPTHISNVNDASFCE